MGESSKTRYSHRKENNQERTLKVQHTPGDQHKSVNAINFALRQKQMSQTYYIHCPSVEMVPENDPCGAMQGKQGFTVSGCQLWSRLYGQMFTSTHKTE